MGYLAANVADISVGERAARALVNELFEQSKAAVKATVDPAIPMPLARSRWTGLGDGRIAMRRLGLRRTFMGARLGKYSDWPGPIGEVRDLLASGLTPYDAFVQYVLNHTQGVTFGGQFAHDAFQVYKAIEAFDKTYAESYGVADATYWGIRFPQDLRNHLATYNVVLDSEVFEAYQGSYTHPPDHPELVYGLTGATDTFFLWMAYVYRGLQQFIPAMAQVYADAGRAPDGIYADFVVPGFSDSARFVLFVVAANPMYFTGIGGRPALQTLRGLVSNAQLEEMKQGEQMAVAKGEYEYAAWQAVGEEIDNRIKALEVLEIVVKVLGLPLKFVTKHIPDLAAAIPWYVWVGGALLAGGITYAVLRR